MKAVSQETIRKRTYQQREEGFPAEWIHLDKNAYLVNIADFRAKRDQDLSKGAFIGGEYLLNKEAASLAGMSVGGWICRKYEHEKLGFPSEWLLLGSKEYKAKKEEWRDSAPKVSRKLSWKNSLLRWKPSGKNGRRGYYGT